MVLDLHNHTKRDFSKARKISLIFYLFLIFGIMGYNGQKWLVKPYVICYTTDNYNTFNETHFIKEVFLKEKRQKEKSNGYLWSYNLIIYFVMSLSITSLSAGNHSTLSSVSAVSQQADLCSRNSISPDEAQHK